MFTSGCCAVRETPAVWVWNRSVIERGSLRAVPVSHPAGPDAAGRPVLGDLLEEIDVGVEEEAQPRCELVDRQPGLRGQLDVGEAVGEREGQLLGGGRAGFADVVARHRDRRATAASRLRRTPWCRAPAASRAGVGTRTPSGPGTPSGCRSAGCRRGRPRAVPFPSATATYMARSTAAGELMVIEVVTSPRSMPANRSSMSPERVHRDAALADLAQTDRIVAVPAHQRRQVEGGGEPGPAGGQQLVEAVVGVLRRTEPGEHAHRPELRAVHRGVGPAGVGEGTRPADGLRRIVGAVERLERDPRHGFEIGVPLGCSVVLLLPRISHPTSVPPTGLRSRQAEQQQT